MSGFKVEGLKVRYREKPINETSNYSRSLDADIDIKDEPQIFLHTDGILYIKDNVSLDPIPLSSFKDPLNSIRVVDGELVFYKNDGSEELKLSDLTANKSSIIRDNSLVFSRTKQINTNTVNTLDTLRTAFVSINGTYEQGVTGADLLYTNIQSEMDSYKSTFLSKFNTTTLRSNNSTIRDTYIDNYVEGLTTNETFVSAGSISAAEYYKTYEFVNAPTTISTFPQTLQNLKYFLNENEIGFDTKDSDLPSKVIFGGKKYSQFKEYLFSKLRTYDGTYAYISSIFGDLGYTGTNFSVPTSGFVISASSLGENDNGYSTINGSVVYQDPLDIDAGGVFSTLTYSNELQQKMIKSVSLSLSSLVHNKISDILETYFRSTISILPSSGDDNDSFVTTYNTPVDIDTMVGHIQTQLSADAQLKTDMDTEINNALDDLYSSYFVGSNENIYGGITDRTKAITIPLEQLNDKWFDLEDFYITTNKIDNKKAISCNANLAVKVKHTSRPIILECRLIDTITNDILDITRVTSRREEPEHSIGDYGNDKYTTVPIELNYTGPITQYDCEQSIDELLEDNTLNVGEHIRLRQESNCATQVCIDEDGNVLRQLVTDLFTGIDSEIIKQNESKINVPRILRVQWRVVVPSDMASPQVDDLDVFEFMGTDNNSIGESRINLSVYSIGDVTGKRVILKGVKNLDNTSKVQVLFDKPFPNSNYTITFSKDKNVNIWTTNKTSNGFTFETNRPIKCEINWSATYQPTTPEPQNTNELPACFVDNTSEFGIKSNFTILKQEGYL